MEKEKRRALQGKMYKIKEQVNSERERHIQKKSPFLTNKREYL
jgi:hypothetical protein